MLNLLGASKSTVIVFNFQFFKTSKIGQKPPHPAFSHVSQPNISAETFIPNQRHNFWLERFKVPVSAHLWYALRTLVAEPSASYPALKNCSLRCKRDMGFAGCGEAAVLQNCWKPKDWWVSNWILLRCFWRWTCAKLQNFWYFRCFQEWILSTPY